MITVHEALDIIERETRFLGSEHVALCDAPSHVLAADVFADMDVPPFDRAQMDGYAVCAADTVNAPAELRIVGEAAAGCGWRGVVKSGEAVRIMTGAPVPSGANAVQQLEVARERADGGCVWIEKQTKPGQFIVERASEVRAGARVLEAGAVITTQTIAALASFGVAQVCVGVRPCLAVIATGAELVDVAIRPKQDQIRDSNSHTLAAFGKRAGACVTRLAQTGDAQPEIEREIIAAAEEANIIVLSGGVSVGAYDHTKAALRALGADVFFQRVKLRPGKPTVFARLGERLVFGLPGNPVSSAVTFQLFARTAIQLMQGAREARLLEERAVLGGSAKQAAGRVSYLPITLRTNEAGVLTADVLAWGGSSDFVAFARATALAIIPEGTGRIEAGTVISIVRLPAA